MAVDRQGNPDRSNAGANRERPDALPTEGPVLRRALARDAVSLTEDATPDGAADYVTTYDASAGERKRVLLNNLPGGGGGGSVPVYEMTAGVPTLAGTRAGIAFEEGSGITLTLTDVPADNLVNVKIDAAGGVASIGATTITATYGVYEYTEAVFDAAAVPGTQIMVSWGDTSEADENSPLTERVTFSAVADAGGGGFFLVTISSDEEIGGPFKINYLIG